MKLIRAPKTTRQLCPSAHAFTYEDSLLFTAIVPVLGSLEARRVPRRLRSFIQAYIHETDYALGPMAKGGSGPRTKEVFQNLTGFCSWKDPGVIYSSLLQDPKKGFTQDYTDVGARAGLSTELLQGLPAPTARPGLVLHVL